jgi:hypothetical protein
MQRNPEPCLVSYDGAVDSPDQTYQKAISRLLITLIGEEAVFNLRSRTSSWGAFISFRTCPERWQLVIQKAPDVDTWNAVFYLIISRLTPSSTVLPSFNSTPITPSSASRQGGEQTREVVERKVFEEIRFCDVEGFFQKYFEGKD